MLHTKSPGVEIYVTDCCVQHAQGPSQRPDIEILAAILSKLAFQKFARQQADITEEKCLNALKKIRTVFFLK